MRSQCARRQAGAVCSQHVWFGQRLRVGVMAQPSSGKGGRFVDVFLRPAVEGNARAAGKNQSPNTVFAAAFDNVPRAEHVNTVVAFPRPPDARHTGDVKHNLDTGACVAGCLGVAHVAT